MSVSSWSLRHPASVVVVTAAIFLFGFLSFLSLNREFVPNVIFPTVLVTAIWPGAGAEDVERDVTMVLEEELASLSGLKNQRSSSAEGLCFITLEFQDDVDSDLVLQEVRAKIRRISENLPEGLRGEPEAEAFSSEALPTFSFAVLSRTSSDRTARYVDDVVLPEIYRVSGVSGVQLFGERELELRIRLETDALATSGIDPLIVLGALQERNLNIPAGTVGWETGEWTFKVAGEFNSLEEVRGLVVGSAASTPVFLGDLADVSLVYPEPEERVRSDGRDVVMLRVMKRQDGNALTMSRELRRRLDDLERDSDGTWEFLVFDDDRELVRLSLMTVITSALSGLLMAVFVIWLFLRDGRSTLAVALSLPVGMVTAFLGMRLAGQSINILTLAGITVSLGMVVDASIVILENISTRAARGDDPRRAAEKGSREVAGAVFASTSTSVSVFAPMIFLTGFIGIILKDLSFTLVLCLLASLASALFLAPLLSSWTLGRPAAKTVRRPSRRRLQVMAKLEKHYSRSLKISLGMPKTVVIASVCILAVSVLVADFVGVSFIPAADTGDFYVYLELPPGSTLEETTNRSDQAESLIRELVPEAVGVVFFSGLEHENVGDARHRETAYGKVRLSDPRRRKREVFDIITVVRDALSNELSGVTVRVVNGGFDQLMALSVGGIGFRVEISSADLETLREAGDQVEAILKRDPDVTGVDKDVRFDRYGLTAVLDGDAMGRLGVSARNAALVTRMAFEGMDVGNYRPPDGQDRTMRVVSDLEGLAPGNLSLPRLMVRTAAGDPVSLDSLTVLEKRRGVSQIQRRDRVRILTVIAHTRGEDIRGISRRLREALNSTPLPHGAEWSVKGLGGLIVDSLKKLAVVLVVALFLVYSVMVIQFGRFIQPLIIMASVPFCFIGVMLGLVIFGSTLSVISFMGIIALGGIVVNNAIVLVDRINQLRGEQKISLSEAVIKGARNRLRPIMMTTLTTFFGVLPLALARGAGSRIYAPLGQAVAGGLITSTLVTLFLVPALYYLVEKKREKSLAVKA